MQGKWLENISDHFFCLERKWVNVKDKIKQRFKKIVPYILIAVLSSTAVLFSYDKGNEVHAMVGVDDVALAGLVTAILMSYGYVTLDYYNNTDGSSALADDWEEAYEQSRFQVLNGGGSGDNNDDDNDDDWEDTDGDGKITEKDIPKFNQLYNPTSGAAAAGATFLITANAGKLLAPIVSKFLYKKYNNIPNSISDSNEVVKKYLSENNIDISGCKYFVTWRGPLLQTSADPSPYRICKYFYYKDAVFKQNGHDYSFQNRAFVSLDEPNAYGFEVRTGSGSYIERITDYGLRSFGMSSDYGTFSFNMPQVEWGSDNTKFTNWIDPNIGDGFDNKGDLELLPPPHSTDISSYNIPTQQALQDLLNNLGNPNLLPEQQKQTLLDFINNLGNKPDPDTGKDPDKNPEPDPNPNPDPNPDTGKDPDKNPEPDPDPNPDTGKDTDNNTFTADLKELFPFCIPFDIVDCFRLFNAEPETPRVKFPIHFGIVDKDYTFDIDLKDFNDVAGVCRTSFFILFMVGLGFATSRVIKW